MPALPKHGRRKFDVADVTNDRLTRARELLEREAAYLDEQRWDEWIALFAQDCEYWVPTWLTEEQLSTDPQTQLSFIYYASRSGLEDRLVRIRSGRSPASWPLRRTAHQVGNVLLEDPPPGMTGEETLAVRSTWTCHVFDTRHLKTYVFFGHAHYVLKRNSGEWKIWKKKTVLQNDYLPNMVDVNCI